MEKGSIIRPLCCDCCSSVECGGVLRRGIGSPARLEAGRGRGRGGKWRGGWVRGANLWECKRVVR